MGTIDKYSIVKAFGIEATLKQINKDAEQAGLAIELIRELTSEMYKKHIEDASPLWAAGPMWLSRLETEVATNISKLREIGVSSEEIDLIRDGWLQPQMLYIMNKIHEKVKGAIREKCESFRDWDRIYKQIKPIEAGSASSLERQMLNLLACIPTATMSEEKKTFSLEISKWIEEFKKSEGAYAYYDKEMWIAALRSAWLR